MRKTFLTPLLSALLAAGTLPAWAADDVVRIGVLNDQSGLYSDFGGATSVIAARMAVEDFGGKVLGKPIEILSADHQNKADVATSVARRWFDVDGVSAVADLTNSAVALAVQQLAKGQGKVTLSSGPATTRLTNEDCSPTGFHWAFDTYSQAVGTAKAVVATGGKSWFILAADYAFGHQMAADLDRVVKESGGTVLGQVRAPTGTMDFSSFLLQAQSSKAKIVGLANAGGDTINSIKQAAEFGIVKGGQKLAGLLVFLPDIHGLGLNTAQGLNITEAFYWDLNDGTRAWSKRFAALHGGKYPSSDHAGVYAGVLHYLKAVDAAKTDDGAKVVAKMKELPTDDTLFGKGTVRADGRKIHPVYLFEVKKPSESKAPYDYYKVVQTIPAEQAFRPLNEGNCPLVTKK